MLGYLILIMEKQLIACAEAAGKEIKANNLHLFNSVTEFVRLCYFRQPRPDDFIEIHLRGYDNFYNSMDEPVELHISKFLKSISDYYNFYGDEEYYRQKKLEGSDNNCKFIKTDTDDFFSLLLDILRSYTSTMREYGYVATSKGIFEKPNQDYNTALIVKEGLAEFGEQKIHLLKTAKELGLHNLIIYDNDVTCLSELQENGIKTVLINTLDSIESFYYEYQGCKTSYINPRDSIRLVALEENIDYFIHSFELVEQLEILNNTFRHARKTQN